MTIDPGLIPLAFAVMAVMALLTIPLAASVFFSAVILLLLNPAPLPEGFAHNYSLAMSLNSPALVSVPLFILAGELAIASGIARRFMNVAGALVGHGPRAAGPRTILGCTLFASVSGMGPGAIAAGGRQLLPAMVKAGFPPEAAAGCLACAAGLSIVIPTSPPLTLYAAASGIVTNIVFTASFIPGLCMAALLLIAASWYTRTHSADRSVRREPAARKCFILLSARWALLMPVLVLSSLFTGFFTAPEAAAFSCLYAVLAGHFAHRELPWKDLWEILGRTAAGASAILLMAGTGGLFALLMAACGFNDRVAETVFRLAGGAAGSILFMNALLLAAGCILDMPAIITLVAPLLIPLAAKCGMSLPHFGVMVVVNIAVGLITPPQAWNIAAAATLAGVGPWRAARAAWPFLAAMLLCLFLVSYIPGLSLALPRFFGWPV